MSGSDLAKTSQVSWGLRQIETYRSRSNVYVFFSYPLTHYLAGELHNLRAAAGRPSSCCSLKKEKLPTQHYVLHTLHHVKVFCRCDINISVFFLDEKRRRDAYLLRRSR